MIIRSDMREGKVQRFQDSWSEYCGGDIRLKDDHQWNKAAAMNGEDVLDCSSPSIDSTLSNGSSSSCCSSSSSGDTRDDASSSLSNSSGSIYDLSELMSQLPIKRGLSKFYQGKSESFTSLTKVTNIDDLKKKEMPCRKRRKVSKSYQAGFNTYKSFTLPKPTITKKAPRTSFSSSIFPSRRVSFNSSSKK